MNHLRWWALSALLGTVTLGGCASSGRFSASETEIAPAAWDAAQLRVQAENVPGPLRDYYLALYSEGKQNEALHAMRGGLAALRLGYFDRAKTLFDLAIRNVEVLQEGAAQAERVQSKFVREQEKWFKGESYERSALYVYRGLLYLRDQDFGNAAACFRRAEINDITGEEARDFGGDWASAELALALASYQNGQAQDAIAALARQDKFKSKPGEVRPPRPENNRLIVVEVGQGPIKYRDGPYGELLRFREEPSAITAIEVQAQQPLYTSAAAEDLYYQATTRGERKIDAILNGKAQFKEGTGVAGAALIGAGAVAVSTGTEAGGYAGAGLALAGLISTAVSAATTPEADVRMWDNLPHSLFFLPITLPPEGGEITLRPQAPSGGSGWDVKIKVLPLGDPQKKLDVLWVRF